MYGHSRESISSEHFAFLRRLLTASESSKVFIRKESPSSPNQIGVMRTSSLRDSVPSLATRGCACRALRSLSFKGGVFTFFFPSTRNVVRPRIRDFDGTVPDIERTLTRFRPPCTLV